MCGRYVSVQERADLVELYNATAVGEALAPSYNVAPTTEVYAVLEHADPNTEEVDRQIRNLRWGLVPGWAEDPTIGNRLINARVETLAGKPSWRSPFRRQRAVSSRPRATTSGRPGNATRRFASSQSKDKSDPTRWLWTAVIITTDATGPARDIHDRTPLILPRDRVNAWLDPTRTEPDQIYEVLDGIVLEPLAVRPVSIRVNRVGADGADLVEPLIEHLNEPLQLSLTGQAA